MMIIGQHLPKLHMCIFFHLTVPLQGISSASIFTHGYDVVYTRHISYHVVYKSKRLGEKNLNILH